MHVVVTYLKGANWRQEGREGEHVSRHIAYQHGLFDAKKLVIGGPSRGEEAGMAVFEVASMDEANEIAQNDPAVKDGFYVVALRSWRIALNRR